MRGFFKPFGEVLETYHKRRAANHCTRFPFYFLLFYPLIRACMKGVVLKGSIFISLRICVRPWTCACVATRGGALISAALFFPKHTCATAYVFSSSTHLLRRGRCHCVQPKYHPSNGCGSKICTQNGTLVNDNLDYNLRSLVV